MTDTAPATDASVFSGLPYETAEEWQTLLENFGKNGRTMRDFTNVSPESMEVFYMVAFNQYNAGQFEEASKVFQLLCSLDHFEQRFWMGLGSSRLMEGKHEDALKAFAYLTFLDMKNPVAAFHCAKCLMPMGKIPEAIAALRAASFNAGDNPEHAALKLQADALIEALEQGQQAATQN